MSDFKTAFFVGAIGGMLAAPFVLLFAWLPLRRKSEADEITHEQRLAVLRNTAVILVLVIVGISGAYLVFHQEGALPTEATGGGMGGGMPGATGAATAPELPGQLAGLERASVQTGQEALAAVQTMNPGGQFPVGAASVATYGSGEATLTVRVAAMPAAEMATADVDMLVQMFSSGQMLLGKAKEVQPGIYQTQGPSSTNYFFAAGSNVWWVEAPNADLAKQGLDEVRSLAG